MKKKDFLFKVLLLSVVAIFSVNFVSCGGDDETKSVKQKLVGVWKTSMSNSNWRCIELESNGTLHYGMSVSESGEISYSSLEGTSNHSAKWIYNEADQTISMFADDGYYNYNYKVNMSDDGNSWSGNKVSGGGDKNVAFTRVR